ncbi:hypothetical protein K438DRAFT_1997915 [Mycena galopus ATCC 62051]|nr:hypothetical protein K438DRAFT_1997915 [Mycena galopus ATCC 62051]
MPAIPDDILTGIFMACLPEAESIPASHFPRPVFQRPCQQNAPLLLCRVSARWRLLALETPRLWSSLDATFVQNYQLVERWLSRSKQVPLSLSLRPSPHSDLPHRYLPLLIPRLQFCNNIEIIGWPVPAGMEPALPEGNLPLQCASVSLDIGDNRSLGWFSELLWKSPSLTCLHWNGPLVLAPWGRLTYLSFCPSYPADLVAVLPQLTNLIELHLIYPQIDAVTGIHASSIYEAYNEFYDMWPVEAIPVPTVTTLSVAWDGILL